MPQSAAPSPRTRNDRRGGAGQRTAPAARRRPRCARRRAPGGTLRPRGSFRRGRIRPGNTDETRFPPARNRHETCGSNPETLPCQGGLARKPSRSDLAHGPRFRLGHKPRQPCCRHRRAAGLGHPRRHGGARRGGADEGPGGAPPPPRRATPRRPAGRPAERGRRRPAPRRVPRPRRPRHRMSAGAPRAGEQRRRARRVALDGLTPSVRRATARRHAPGAARLALRRPRTAEGRMLRVPPHPGKG